VTVQVPVDCVGVVLHVPSFANLWNLVVCVNAPGLYVSALLLTISLHVVPPSVELCHLYVIVPSPPLAGVVDPISPGSPPEHIVSPSILIPPAENCSYTLIKTGLPSVVFVQWASLTSVI